MKRVLCFVLSSHNPPYEQMIQTSMETWDSVEVHGVRTVFYCGNPANINNHRVISFPVDESYFTISKKNLLAFDRALEWDWEYMVRPNSSCYVHKQRLLEYCQTLPDYGVAMGVLASPTHASGTNRPFLWGGAQFIFSRDVIEKIRNNQWCMRHDIMEDVALSEIIRDVEFEPTGNLRSCSINKLQNSWNMIGYNGESRASDNFPDLVRGTDHFLFRIKHDSDRTVDAEVMSLLKTHL